jgi:oligosaccharide repeat unit polymerase
MGYAAVNALLYVIAIVLYSFKRRKIDAGFVLLAAYAFIAILGVALYESAPSEWKLQLWPFLYLFVICMMFFRQFNFDSDTLYEKLKKPNLKALYVFCIIYIVCSLISIYYGLENAMQNIISGNFRDAYIDNSIGGIAFYSNQFDRIAKILAQYFQPVAMLALFYYLTLKNIKSFRVILLAVAIIFPTFISSIIIGSRSVMIKFIVTIVICYFIFHKGISKKRKLIIMIPSISFILLVFIFMTAVTNSRFGEAEGALSVFYYLGHSMLTFNYGVTDTIHSYSNGKIFFSWFIDALGGNSKIDFLKLGTHCDGAFTTFAGPLYMDFGPIGTFVIAAIAPVFISFFFRHKKQIDMANIYMFVFSLNYIIYGVLVSGYDTGLIWGMAIIIYGILKLTLVPKKL